MICRGQAAGWEDLMNGVLSNADFCFIDVNIPPKGYRVDENTVFQRGTNLLHPVLATACCNAYKPRIFQGLDLRRQRSAGNAQLFGYLRHGQRALIVQ